MWVSPAILDPRFLLPFRSPDLLSLIVQWRICDQCKLLTMMEQGAVWLWEQRHPFPTMSNSLPPSPPDLTQTQKSDLQRLWEIQTREVKDVRPTSESNSDSKPSLSDGLTCKMMTRLHVFFLSFFEYVCGNGARHQIKQLLGEEKTKSPFWNLCWRVV